MLWFIIALILFGLLAGAVARLLVPGREPMGLVGTWALGIGGSFVGGFLGWFLLGADINEGAVQTAGLLGSIIGAIVILVVRRQMNRPRRRRI